MGPSPSGQCVFLNPRQNQGPAGAGPQALSALLHLQGPVAMGRATQESCDQVEAPGSKEGLSQDSPPPCSQALEPVRHCRPALQPSLCWPHRPPDVPCWDRPHTTGFLASSPATAPDLAQGRPAPRARTCRILGTLGGGRSPLWRVALPPGLPWPGSCGPRAPVSPGCAGPIQS